MARKLTLQERIALIYTSQGSQRAVARLLGISHQKVGRILRTGQEGGYAPEAKTLRDPELNAIVSRGFAAHRETVKAQARRDGIPYIPEIPIYTTRLAPIPRTREVVDPETGEISRVPVIDPRTGQQELMQSRRAEAQHIHWLPDKLRQDWMTATQRTRHYVAASVQSMVNLKVYFKAAEKRFRDAAKVGIKRTEEQKAQKKKMAERIRRMEREGRALDVVVPAFTKMQPLDFAESTVRNRIEAQLRQKHQPATGPDLPGTMLAASVLLQIDPTREPRNAPRKQKAAARKARPKAPR